MTRAADEMRAVGMIDGLQLEFVSGPDRYLLGEETGLTGVIEDRGPFPREVRPFMHGLFATSATDNPTLVNNVETLANVPWIVSLGPEWLRSVGTEASPGTMLFTVAGDVEREGVFELTLGTTMAELIVDVAGAKNVKAVLPGASNAVILPDGLDMPLDFDAMRAAGTGLGAGGFAVYDETACMVEVLRQFARFLHVESCAQCPACKVGSGAIFDLAQKVQAGEGDAGDFAEIVERAGTVTDGQKCALPTGTERLVLSLIESFSREFAHHVGRECPLPRELVFPKLVDFDEEAGKFLYDRAYESVTPQWTEDWTGAQEAEK
jgi:NADH:ubiquinone oxidoreductase subunit F (NADH-binding)